MDTAKLSDLATLLGDLSQWKKLSDIKPSGFSSVFSNIKVHHKKGEGEKITKTVWTFIEVLGF